MPGRCAKIKEDRTIYMVACEYRNGPYWSERDVGDTDRATTIDHIRSGNLSHVVKVLECNSVEHLCRDVTEEILAEVEQQRREREDNPRSHAEIKQAVIDALREHERDLVHDGLYGWPR